MKILQGLRKSVNRNAEYYKKKLGEKKKKKKTGKISAEMKAELKALNSRMNNAKEQIRFLKDRIMEITQSEQYIESQMKKMKTI